MSVDDYGKILFNYLKLDGVPLKSDVILGLGGSDTRVAERSAELMLEEYGEILVFSGGYGRITEDMNTQPEAEIFRDIAIKCGISPASIFIDVDASNTGENIRFTQELLKRNGVEPYSILIVTKPYMERRAYATFMKQWEGANSMALSITSPKTTYDEQWGEVITKEIFLNTMVADLERIREYPKKGFQIEQEIPKEVLNAYDMLVAEGFTKYLTQQ